MIRLTHAEMGLFAHEVRHLKPLDAIPFTFQWYHFSSTRFLSLDSPEDVLDEHNYTSIVRIMKQRKEHQHMIADVQPEAHLVHMWPSDSVKAGLVQGCVGCLLIKYFYVFVNH